MKPVNKWIAIGDIHGRQNWKAIVNAEFDRVDRIIFLGDYFDSFNIPVLDQIENFKDLIQLKRDYPDKIVLLTGNHDLHYISSVNEHYSGKSKRYDYIIEMDCVLPAIQDRSLQLCHIENDFLFTHAGVTQTWLKETGLVGDLENLEQLLNDELYYRPGTFRFRYVHEMQLRNSRTGNNIWQGPLWVRPESLLMDKILGYTQVVGHTEMLTILYGDGVYFIDCLEENYYLYSDGVNPPEIKQLSL